MLQPLTPAQHARYDEFTEFARERVQPCAEEWDRRQRLPDDLIAELGRRGFLGASLPADAGGSGWDTVTWGLLHEACGRASSALTDLLTVQVMVSMTVRKWGTLEQRNRWLPRLAAGDAIGAFALTEPDAGSALDSLATTITRRGSHLVVTGTKTWITAAQHAGVFLVFGIGDGGTACCLVPSDTPGVSVEPITDLLGFRAAGLGRVQFDEVEIAPRDLVGRPGTALTHVAPLGLHFGRISTACSALGLLRGCVEESACRCVTRRVGGRMLGELDAIRSLVARMGVDLEAARGLCLAACRAQDDRSPTSFADALTAKYFTSRAAARAAADAVQIAGAAGCQGDRPVARYYRDAKLMEIIEGTTQIHEQLLGRIFIDGGAAWASVAGTAG